MSTHVVHDAPANLLAQLEQEGQLAPEARHLRWSCCLTKQVGTIVSI